MSADTIGKALQEYFDSQGITQVAIADKLGVSKAYVNSLFTGKRPFGKKQAETWETEFGISRTWLLTGEGEMRIETDTSAQAPIKSDGYEVPLIPVHAFAGPITESLENGVFASECEKIISPVSGAQWAMPISGDSMEPKFSDGSIIYMTRINDMAFIPWGNPMVVDTENGVFLKNLYPASDADYIEARSNNPKYPPFLIPKCSIYGIYRVINVSKFFITM